MGNAIDKLMKMKGKSWTEIIARSEQAISSYGEQIGISGNSLSDEEFASLLDKSVFAGGNVSAESLFGKFFQNSASAFFPSFRQKEKTLQAFRQNFGEKSARTFIEKAEKIVEGKFDLLGFSELDFGAAVDWHYEPISRKHSPIKHWKQFDELATDETGDKKIIWELNRHQHFFTLGVAFWLSKDERFAATFARHLESWMEQNPPGMGINWASSLEVAFRAMSWIWAFQFFRDSASFTPELFRKSLKFLFLHGRHIEKYLSTYYSPNTHLTGEALGLYYLGTQLPFFSQSAQWRKLGEEILLAELDRQILGDGVYFEQSTWYQRYTTDFYTQFHILRLVNGSDIGSAVQEKLDMKLQSALDFMMSVTRPDGTTPLVGDDDGGACLPRSNGQPNDFRAVLSTGAVIFSRGDYKFVAEDFAEETLWLMGTEAVEAFTDLLADRPEKTSSGFTEGGYFVMRDGWAETDNYLLIDCGEIGALSAGHGHADALSIDLAIGGRTVLADSGTYTYHESEDARNYFRSTAAHNTLTIDGKSQSEPSSKFSWQTKAQTKLHSWISQDRFDFFEGSHDGYERLTDAPAAHTRSILFLKNDYWIMRDFVETRGKHDYRLNFHFNAGAHPLIESAQSGGVCVGEASDTGIGLRFFTCGDNGDWHWEESTISPVYGKRLDAPLVRFASSGTGSQEFFTFLLPDETGFAAPEVTETHLDGGRAFVINYREYQDIFVFSDGEKVVSTEIFDTNFRFLWARLSPGESLPEEFVMVGGSHFSIDGKEIVNRPQSLEFATARRLGSQLNVRTSESVFSVLLAQKNVATYVMKN